MTCNQNSICRNILKDIFAAGYTDSKLSMFCMDEILS